LNTDYIQLVVLIRNELAKAGIETCGWIPF
jgi:hypothetical protein